jgi:hypothetical protein
MRRGEFHPGLHEFPGHLRLGEFQHPVGGPGPLRARQGGATSHEAALALLGVNPPLVPKSAQSLDDRGAGQAELGHELLF